MMNSTPDEFSDPVAIAAHDLVVSRGGNEVLHRLTFEIPRGTIVGLMGPSGCGKTTLMRSIVGVQAIESGSLKVLSRRPSDAQLRRQLGYVTQAVSVYRDLTARQNTSYFAALQGFSPKDADQAIATVGLTEYADRPVEKLSGGQASRVSLACALVGEPKLLVLDEPTVGLDPLTRDEIWTYLKHLAEGGTTLLVSSHVMDEAARCDSVMLMREGKLLAHTTPDDLLARTGERTMDAAFLALIRRGGHR
ncbi:ABC transporter ATP-binding protein [Yimella sp. cx-51]|uniref:ABC transporter ATP-binding protein n=1 Tax=Yimella sp. cx-51 TaxID=2770551 RepID=UPI00165E8D52|nr:ABC transporter ATP-binding protein [Yimella sp. cx-51]MBC9956084.1 ABC transporter ATP-binding protein [Yimella sp. cx-51]QTH37385.1 ABC transporter ATP-binding protein [Yimella sp. cx-51]